MVEDRRFTRFRDVRVIAISIGIAAVMVGCSSSSTPAPATSTGSPAITSQAPTGGAILQQGAGGQLVFSPAKLTVKQGTAVTVSNLSASTPHTFTVTGQGIDITNNGGQSQSVTINLALGTYPFICRFHVAEGMREPSSSPEHG